MSIIDIRFDEATEIRFADGDDTFISATSLTFNDDNEVGIFDHDVKASVLWIKSEEDALNLIQALEMAIELGWFKE
jgi:hypothetical protein